MSECVIMLITALCCIAGCVVAILLTRNSQPSAPRSEGPLWKWESRRPPRGGSSIALPTLAPLIKHEQKEMLEHARQVFGPDPLENCPTFSNTAFVDMVNHTSQLFKELRDDEIRRTQPPEYHI